MKEIVTITIAKQIFQIDKEAYRELDDYLESVRKAFGFYPDGGDIVFDIESGIAEHFKDKSDVISKADVKETISQIGQPEDIEDGNEQIDAKKSKKRNPKKFYRDTDSAIVAGVSSGIATYLGIDPLFIRIAFALLVFANGAGLIAYFVLWAIMPVAKTSADKLHMRGRPVTLGTLRSMTDKGVKNIKAGSDGLSGLMRKAGHAIAAVIGAIGKFFAKGLWPLVRNIVGGTFMLAATIAAVVLAAIFFTVIFNADSTYVDSSLLDVLSGPYLAAVLATGFVIAFVPVIFLGFFGRVLITKRIRFSYRVVVTLLALWFVAIVAGAALTPEVIGRYRNYVATDPTFEQVSQSFDLPQFHAIDVSDSSRVILIHATEQRVVANGRRLDIDKLNVKVENGVLEAGRQGSPQACFFCFGAPVEFTIHAPAIDFIGAHNSSRVETDGFPFADLVLDVRSSSRVMLGEVAMRSMEAYLRNSSLIDVRGTADTLSVDVANSSSFRGEGFTAGEAHAVASNSSSVYVSVTGSLDATARNSSRIRYSGDPEVTNSSSRNSSSVEKIGETL